MARFAPKHVAWYQRNRHHHPKFIYYFFHTLKLERYSTGSGVPTLNRNDIHSLKKFIPSLPEQQKIADFLSTVDKKIQALTRKKELLEQYKKGVMQKIFSQEIRFKPAPSEVEGKEDGSDYPEWEILRAKDLFKNYSNKNHNGNLPILAVTQDRGVIDRSSLEMKIQTSQSSINSYKLVEIGDFVISLRSFQGGIEYSNIGGICSPAYTILKPLKKINDSDSFYKVLHLKNRKFHFTKCQIEWQPHVLKHRNFQQMSREGDFHEQTYRNNFGMKKFNIELVERVFRSLLLIRVEKREVYPELLFLDQSDRY